MAVKNVASILQRYAPNRIVLVISAMGKTTNALEKIARAHRDQSGEAGDLLEQLRAFHLDIMQALFEDPENPVFTDVHNLFIEVEWILDDEPMFDFACMNDQIVSVGELISTRILSAYLNASGIPNQWLDARDYIKTDDQFGEARVDWDETSAAIRQNIPDLLKDQLVVTQGFIGVNRENYTTTLGREGSDFSAAIFAHVLMADKVVVWKDVPGILSADPKHFEDPARISNLSYYEAVEMTFYGAKVIHPKTIKPLQNKDIPLEVRSFEQTDEGGTLIESQHNDENLPPIVVLKQQQILISFASKDFSFISEDNLSLIYGVFARERVKINMMQLAALSFTVCVDHKPSRIKQVISALQSKFKIRSNENLELITIRHYNEAIIEKLTRNKQVLLEQKSRTTVQLVVE